MSSRAEALENSKKLMELHSQHWPGWEGTSEVFEMEEYGRRQDVALEHEMAPAPSLSEHFREPGYRSAAR